MRIVGVSLGNRGGDFEVRSTLKANLEIRFQAVANGLVFFESEGSTTQDYEKARAAMIEGVRLNTRDTEHSH